jgi:hypothetical protein
MSLHRNRGNPDAGVHDSPARPRWVSAARGARRCSLYALTIVPPAIAVALIVLVPEQVEERVQLTPEIAEDIAIPALPVADLAPAERRGFAFAIYNAVLGIGAFAASVVFGLVLTA